MLSLPNEDNGIWHPVPLPVLQWHTAYHQIFCPSPCYSGYAYLSSVSVHGTRCCSNGSIEEATPPLVKSLTFLGTSFALFNVKDQHIEKLQQALDQQQQLHAVSQNTVEAQRLQLEEVKRPQPLLARLKAVFVPE